jgi:hypothetical protein
VSCAVEFRVVFKKCRGLGMPNCPFVNLPHRDKGRWGEGLTAEKMVECRWLKLRLTAQIEYAEWTEGNHLRIQSSSRLVTPTKRATWGPNRRPPNKSHPRRAGFSSIPVFKRARKSLLSACSAGDFPFEASQLSKSLIRTWCST